MFEDTVLRRPGPRGKLLSDAAAYRTPGTPKSLLESCLEFSIFNELDHQDPFEWASHVGQAPTLVPSPRPAKRRRLNTAALFRVASASPQVPQQLKTPDTPKVKLVQFGGKSLCFIQWKEGSQHFVYNEVVKVFFPERARSSVNLRLLLLGTPNTVVEHTDYMLARILKSVGAVNRRSCSALRLIEFTDLLRLIMSFQFEPRLKTGCKDTRRIHQHLFRVDSAVTEKMETARDSMEKLRVLAKILHRNEE